MSTPFRYYLRVRYGECDPQKVVFNARYGDYVDVTVMEFVRAIGFGKDMASGEFDFQNVKQTIEWKAPARYDDVIEASVRCIRVGTTSFVVQIEFRRAGAEQVLCLSETVYVCVDRSLTKKILSAEVREQLQAGAPGVVVDHAAFGVSGDSHS